MKSTLARGLMLVCLTSPVWAQEPTAASVPTAATQAQRDRLLCYGTRLLAIDRQYKVFDRITALATQDQLDALQKLRISPQQGADLLKLIGDNMPTGTLDSEGFKALRRKITPKAEDILGSEQFDRLLELLPSPQQSDRIKAILNEAAATPEGKHALAAANDLSATLSTDQRNFLDPVLGLMRNPQGKPPAPPAKAKKPAKPAAGERRLVFLRKTDVGETYAEVFPNTDFLSHVPHRFRIEGGDASVLSALSNSSGLPVRVLGNYQGGLLQVAKESFSAGPSLLAVPGDSQVWRGRLPAKLLSPNPPTVQLDAGRGQTITAQLEFHTPQERQQFDKVSANGTFLVGATAMVKGPQTTLVDMDFAAWHPPPSAVASTCLIQVSEQMMRHAAAEYLAGHPDQFNKGSGQVSFQVSEMGATLQGCQPGQIRLYGRLSGAHSGLTVLESTLEVVAKPTLDKGKLQLAPIPGTLQVRLNFPFFAETPPNWIANLERIMGSEYSKGVTMSVTDPYKDDIVKSGLLEASQLDQMQLFTLPSGDRRTALVSLAVPAAAAPIVPALQSRIEIPGECTVAVSELAINTAIKAKLPPMLPMTKAIPKDLQQQGGVTLSEVDIPELDLIFQQGIFHINTCVVNVHWSYGLFSGIEPGVRFKGTAKISGSGSPLKLTANLQIESLEWLSPRILGESPEEQKSQKDKLIKALQETPLELPVPADVAATLISPRASLVLTGVRGSENPSELLLQGRLQP